MPQHQSFAIAVGHDPLAGFEAQDFGQTEGGGIAGLENSQFQGPGFGGCEQLENALSCIVKY